jgi:hypothetical protein
VEYYLLRFVAGIEMGFDLSQTWAARGSSGSEAVALMSFDIERMAARQALELARAPLEAGR